MNKSMGNFWLKATEIDSRLHDTKIIKIII